MLVGIIGTRWGLMHVGAFRSAGAEVCGISGKDLARTRQVAQREGISLATDDVAELCRRSQIVVVASPDAMHVEHVSMALRAGAHVLCEKPLTLRAEDAETLVTLAAQRPD